MVEVSDSRLPYDRNVTPELWIVDLQGEAVERYNDPREDEYRRIEKARRGEELASEALPGLFIPMNNALRG